MSGTAPTISIVTPSLDSAAFLEEAVNSVLNQDYPNIEYVIIDGGSTDGSIDIIRRHEAHLAWWISETDRGMYDALNKGFAHVTGDIMGYLNADDLLVPWAFPVIGDIFARFPEIEWLTTLHPLAWDGRGRAVRCSQRRGYSAREFLAGANLPSPSRPVAHWIQQESTFWRRSLWDRAGGAFDDSLAAAGDFDLWARFFRHAELHGVDTPIGGFRRHGDQKSLRDTAGYGEEATAALVRHGGRPRGFMASALRETMNRLYPNRLRPMACRLGLQAMGPIVVFDWKEDKWRIQRG